MNNNITNRSSFLRTSREFPEDIHQLTVQINKTYLEIANAVNGRIIGIFPTTQSAITGENWFLTRNARQQTLRKVFSFTTTANINHGISINVINSIQFTRCFGTFTDGTNSYGLIFGSNVAIAGQISFYITSTQIIFLIGAGAPALTNGIIVLEWLSAV